MVDSNISNFLNSNPVIEKEYIPINATQAKSYFENWMNKNVVITLQQEIDTLILKDIINNCNEEAIKQTLNKLLKTVELQCKLLNIVSLNGTSIAIVEQEMNGRWRHRLIPLCNIKIIDIVS
jgi:hypothetical protein